VSSMHSVAVVVPCYNEEQRLRADTFMRELSNNPSLTILFVNDGSRDNTLGVIQRICDANPASALCLSLGENSGKGEAVRRGMLYLLEKGNYDIIGFWDADLAVPLSEIWDFAEIFRQRPNVQGVIGTRAHLAGHLIERVKFRHYMGRLFATVMCLTFDFEIYDTQCGAKLFNSKILPPVIEEPFCSRWVFDVELIIRISRIAFLQNKNKWLHHDSWLYEMPVKEWRNVSGTKRSLSAYSTAILDYMAMIRKYLL